MQTGQTVPDSQREEEAVKAAFETYWRHQHN